MAVPFFLSVPLLLLLCQHGSGSLCSPENTYTDEGLPCAEVDALEKIIVSLGLPKPLVSHTYCSPSDDKSISFECGACNESTTNSCRRITSLVTHRLPLHGQIDESLSNLTHLTKIDLSRNQLHGTIPESLGKLTRLKTLRLGFNRLSGQIPPTLGNLEALETLDLQSNFLNDSIPPSLGKLMNLTILFLSYNMLSGRIPKELGNLLNLNILSLSENRLSGYLPQELGNLSKLGQLSLHSNSLTGTLPDSFVNLKSLHRLNVTGLRSSVSGNKLSGEIPPFIANFTKLTHLVLRNCSLTGGIPDYIGNNWKSLYYLDLSFNDLSGSIHKSLTNASLERLSLTNNKLNGSIPPWILKTDKADLSYNNFADFIKDNITDPAHHDSTEVKTLDPGKPNMDSILALNHSLFINCGGARVNAEGNPYDEDISTESFFSVPGTWAYSCSGDFIATNRNSSEFVKNMTSGVSVLYKTARFCPVSLKYYGFCLRKAIYTVELHFAETIYTRDEYYSSLGTRIFDVYIQKIEGSQHIEMAKGPNVEWKANSPAIVDDDNPLEIHFSRRGKGSLRSLNGPLVSAISSNLRHKIKLSVRKISPPSEQREKDELKSDMDRKISPPSEKREKDELKSDIDRKIYPPSKQREKDELKSDNFLDILKSLSPENLVRLVDGYSNKDLHLLIYEYMETGSLHKALFEQKHTNTETELDWPTRFDICLGIAKGLNYLHEEEEKSIKIKIVHGNLNAKNILLDKTLTPKLSDFGLATIYNEEDPFTAIKARGSRVYLAPEHALGKAITVKADVYSYGIVVLEIVSGKSNAEYNPNQEADFLLDTARKDATQIVANLQRQQVNSRVLRNCSLTGGIPDYIGNNWTALRYLDLSFNNLSGSIPQSLKNALRLVLTNNKLNGSIPPWILKRHKVDLSYNNFADFIKDNITDPAHHDSTEVKTLDPGKPNMDSILALSKKCTSKHHSLFINCGGASTNAEGNPYDEDVSTETFFSVPGTWAYSCSGDSIFEPSNSSDFVKKMTCGASVSEESLYKTARSLKYYGFCLRKGNYTVQLHFAETIYTWDEYYSSSGTRIFDVYIQGERQLKDLNIIEMAKGPNEAWKRNFTAIVDENPLEIHFFWAGKGSLFIPGAPNGPLVSAISVTPNFDVHDGNGKLSASQIAGITIGCAFAPLLLFLFAWQMGLLGNRELREKQIEVQNRSFTLQQIIDGTKNFSSKMEIGRGRFGVVYKANLPDQIKLAVKKISPPSEQREKDELKSEIGNLISLSHENLVQLLGGYSNKDLHLLIYEYMETGSLHKALFEQRHTSTETELNWSARFDICLGIAKGLNYLHEEEEKSIKIKIVHGNINAKNILLDKTLTAKLSDFGLATIYNEEDPFTAIKARGSRVYMAPEHALGKAITVKADVYSYGVVRVEIVSGESNTEYIPNQEADFLLDTNFLNDSIPQSLGSLKNLTTLSLSQNRLSGPLPRELGNLSKLEDLSCDSNNLTGRLPDSFVNLKSLLSFIVSGNKLSGEIPPFIANFTNLTYLTVSDLKNTSFRFPEIGNLTSINYLVLRNCSLTGGIPDYIGNNWKSLYYLDLSFNDLSGSIPQSLQKASLDRLLLTNNELNGSIPLRIVHQNGERKLTDLNIIEKAKGPNKAWKTSFPAIVDDNPLEIHFFWAGKGSLFNPAALNGPLVSAISVTPIHDGKLSASQIAGITIGCAFAPLLLFLFVWQMRLLGNRELRVQLLGGYSKKDLHLLIYEYMETGSLHKALFEQRHTSTETELSWSARFDICLGIAKGLNYLHEEEEKSIKIKIVHGNINAKNILLDKTHTAKLSDFGLATIYNEEDPFQSIKARETRVYMAPEHALGKAITVKADVYSYGVVVLEIVSGRSNTEYIPNQEADFLLDTAGRLHQQGRFLNLVDKKLGSRFDNKQALTLLHLAMECINQSPTLRPSMSEGERKLKDLNIIEMAKGPNEAWKTNFTAIVDDNNPLEIHFFWAGKGSLFNPPALNGPLVSAISVTPNFNVHDGKLSASQIAGITIGCAFAPLLLFLFVWKMRLLGNRELREKQIEVQNRSFTLQQIIDGTKNFSSKMEIGRGRFGVANLPDQIKLAVKKISPPSEQREKDELKSEIGNLTSLSHENLVQLFGGYSSKDLHLLIYEYMETGSLQKALFEQRHTNTETELHWSARFDICLGIAKGLNYLHEEEEKSIKIKIVHGNINAKNILLDKNQTAKLSDFGLATIYNEEDPFTAIKARGSRVYMAPEHALGKAITVKADVGHI
uniref:non-specific serine/threonine protein kinase n=1 Tax=Salix viminalis TaxID=40686 RepID=A0A6N2K1R8_SALVM